MTFNKAGLTDHSITTWSKMYRHIMVKPSTLAPNLLKRIEVLQHWDRKFSSFPFDVSVLNFDLIIWSKIFTSAPNSLNESSATSPSQNYKNWLDKGVPLDYIFVWSTRCWHKWWHLYCIFYTQILILYRVIEVCFSRCPWSSLYLFMVKLSFWSLYFGVTVNLVFIFLE